MLNSRVLGVSASISLYLAVFAGCSASVDAPSHDGLEGQADAAAPSAPASNEAKTELITFPGPGRPICLASECNSACAAQTGFPGNSGGICEDTQCVCCSNKQYPATVSAELFNLLVASQLSGIKVTVAGNNLTTTLPKQLGGSTTTSPISSSANIAFLAIPSEESSAGWRWSMGADSNLITITSTLDATITGSWSGVNLGLFSVGSCGVTAVITSAPVTITLQNNVNYTLTGPENYLSVQSVSIPLSGSNTEANGCSFVPADDIRGQFQSQLESNLQSQLNGLSVMSTMMDSIVQTIANDDPAALNFPVSLPSGMSWSCGTALQAALGTGGITGECQESCN
jgi:hypothetical protein